MFKRTHNIRPQFVREYLTCYCRYDMVYCKLDSYEVVQQYIRIVCITFYTLSVISVIMLNRISYNKDKKSAKLLR